jgi:F-type H+-transporting ATPase subunit b
MEIISKIALISINETIIAQLISFLIFLYIINRLMFRPLQHTMAERNIHIENLKTDIEDAENQLENVIQDLKIQEDTTRKKAGQLREEIEEKGAEEANRILAEARTEIDSITEENRKQIDRQIEEAQKTLEKESEILSVKIMEKVLERRLVS